MKKIIHILAALLLLLMNSSVVKAQLTITPGATAMTLANRLAGTGVTIIGATLNCDTSANGTFYGVSSLSFDTGIILTTGKALSSGFGIGAGGPASSFASTSHSLGGDAMLTALAGLTTYDACILEFDFRPAGDTVKFDYVFGSEEYTNYTCTNYNDVFGFFISGPLYAGATNIALVPGTSIPVCINSVNCGPTGAGTLATCTAMGPGSPFCTYYVDNSSGTTITYDGITTTLTAIARVSPCDTYHLKLGIADGFDWSFDSGVFLKAGSLTSTAVGISSSGLTSSDTTVGQYTVRGCSPASFIFNTSAASSLPQVFHFVIGGTAINGVDYLPIADSVIIAPGDTTASVTIQALTGTTGTRSVVLYLYSPVSCGGVPVILDSAVLMIYDSLYLNILTPDTSICVGQTAYIRTSGDPSLIYSWTPSSTLSSGSIPNPVASPAVTTTYTVIGIFPGSGCAPSQDVVTITVVQPFTVNAGADTQNTCVGVNYPLTTTVTPSGSYNYMWTPATYLSSTGVGNPTFNASAPGNYYYIVTATQGAVGCYARDTIMMHVLPNDFTVFNHDTAVCFNAAYQVYAVGSGEFTYHWSPASQTSNPDIVDPFIFTNNTVTFSVVATYPGCPDMLHTLQVNVESPTVDINPNDTVICVGESIPIDVIVGPNGTFGTYNWSSVDSFTSGIALEPTFRSMVTGEFVYTLSITSPLGCLASDTMHIAVRPSAKMVLSSSGVTTINLGESVQLSATNLTPFTQWYWWTPNNGTLSNANISNPIATPTDSTYYTCYAMNQWGCRDSSSIIIKINDEQNVTIPDAFTPNGDGMNDYFKIPYIGLMKLAEMRVFNRWGEEVFSTSNPANGWDGTYKGVPQDMGVYNYVIILNHPTNGKATVYKGSITLIR